MSPTNTQSVVQELNRGKLKELILYVCSRCEQRELLGSTKLHKILWFSDLVNFAKTGKSITGETYIKRQFGPVSKHLLEIVRSLENDSSLLTRNVPGIGYEKKEFIPLREPKISDFTPEEISLIDQVIDVICYQHTAGSISEATLNRIWELAEIGEELPLSTVFSRELGEINEHDIRWAKQVLGPPSS